MPINVLKYFNLLYDPIHLPIEIINEEGKIVYVNPAFIYQWDYSFSELKEYSVFNDSEIKNSKIIESIMYLKPKQVFQLTIIPILFLKASK